MKEELANALENTLKALDAIHDVTRDGGPAVHNNNIVLLAALTPPILAAFVLGEVGAWVVGEIGRQIRIREKRPASPSLRGIPTPAELEDNWSHQPRSLATCLRLGSRLADLDSTLDHSLVRRPDATGRMVIRARKGGMKGWLEDRRIKIGYSTAMRYKKLVQRLRQVLSLDERIPLEWILEGLPEEQPLPDGLASSFQAARRRLARTIRENPTLKALSLYVDKELGIIRLVSIRKARTRRMAGPRRVKQNSKARKIRDFSVISQGRRANLSPERVKATKAAMAKVLAARNLSGGALHLQNRLRAWLAGISADLARTKGQGCNNTAGKRRVAGNKKF